MFDGFGWFVLIPKMHNAFVAWLYPILGLYIILYVINLCFSFISRRR